MSMASFTSRPPVPRAHSPSSRSVSLLQDMWYQKFVRKVIRSGSPLPGVTRGFLRRWLPMSRWIGLGLSESMSSSHHRTETYQYAGPAELFYGTRCLFCSRPVPKSVWVGIRLSDGRQNSTAGLSCLSRPNCRSMKDVRLGRKTCATGCVRCDFNGLRAVHLRDPHRHRAHDFA